MGMLDMILQSGLSNDVINSMASKTGLNQNQIGDVVTRIAPVLLGKANANFKSDKDSSNLVKMINQTDMDKLQERPEVLQDQERGNAMLSELMESKDESRSLASSIGNELGVDIGAIKNLIPMVAPLVLGGLNKQANATNANTEDPNSMASMLSGFLDRDGDGSIADDFLDMAGSFFKK